MKLICLSQSKFIYFYYTMNYLKNMQNNSFTTQAKILELQIKYLNQRGPPLGLFASNNRNISIFREFQQKQLQIKGQILVKVELNISSYIRTFYFCLLHLLYQQQSTQIIRKIQSTFKQFAYSQQIRLDIFKRSEIQPRYLEFYQNNILKKILVEFLQVLSYSRGYGNITKMFRKYPIMDFIFILLIRSFMKFREGNNNYLFLNYEIQAEKLMNFFVNQFQIPIKKISNQQYHFSLNKLNILEYHHQLLILTSSFKIQNNNQDHNNIRLVYIKQETSPNIFNSRIHNKLQNGNKNNSNKGFVPKINIVNNQVNKKKFSFNKSQNQWQQSNKNQFIQQNDILKFGQQQQQNNNQDQSPFNKLKQFDQQNQNIDIEEQNQNFIPFWQRVQPNPFLKEKTQEKRKQSTTEYDLYDGMTSEEVLKIMSPKIVQSVKQKKANSVKEIQRKQSISNSIPEYTTETSMNSHSRNKKRYSMITPQQVDFLFLQNNKDEQQNEVSTKNLNFQKQLKIKPDIKKEVEKITQQIQKTLRNKPNIILHKKSPSAQFFQAQSPYYPITQVPKKLPSFSQFTDDFIQKKFLSPTHKKDQNIVAQQKLDWNSNNYNFVRKTNNSDNKSKTNRWDLYSTNNNI